MQISAEVKGFLNDFGQDTTRRQRSSSPSAASLRCMEELFPLFASCRRLCGVLFHPQLHDPFDQVIGDRLIQGKLKIALRSSVACNSYFKRLVARNRWI